MFPGQLVHHGCSEVIRPTAALKERSQQGGKRLVLAFTENNVHRIMKVCNYTFYAEIK